MRLDRDRLLQIQSEVDILVEGGIDVLLEQAFAQILQVDRSQMAGFHGIGIGTRQRQQLVHQLRGTARGGTQAVEIVQRQLHHVLL